MNRFYGRYVHPLNLRAVKLVRKIIHARFEVTFIRNTEVVCKITEKLQMYHLNSKIETILNGKLCSNYKNNTNLSSRKDLAIVQNIKTFK